MDLIVSTNLWQARPPCDGSRSSARVFFDRLERDSFTASFKHATPVVIALFLAAPALSLVLPSTAVGDEEAAEI